jgi:HK97 family phage major capsid protein
VVADTAAIKERREELEKIRIRVNGTLAEYKTGLPAEKDLEVGALLKRAGEIKTEIEQEEKLEAKKADLADLDKFLNEPVRRHPMHGDGGGLDDGRKAMQDAGWDLKGGIWCAPNSLEGKTIPNGDGGFQTLGKVPMYPDEVLFGDIPNDDPERAHFFKTTRAAMAPEYRKAYGNYIRLTAMVSDPGMIWSKLSGSEQKALSEGSDPAGGFLVPPDMQAELLVRVAQMAVIRQYARVQATSRDVLRWPAVLPNATSGSIYSSGFVGGWVGETPAFTETDPGFQYFDIPVRKLRVATKLSNDFVADSAVNILAFLAQNGAENMALVEDSGFLNGNGGSLQPMGILNSGISTVDVEGSTSNTISNTTSAAGSAPKLIDVVYAVPAQYVSRSRWLMARSIEGKIRKLVDFQGRFLWPPAAGSNFAGTPRSLMDYPIDNSDFMPTDGADANKVLLFGDLSAYIIAQRAQISSVVLRERFADTDQVGIILFERVGGGVWNTDAMRIGIV